jgi:hypothetical protein
MSISLFFLLAFGLTAFSLLLAFFIAYVTFRPHLNAKLVDMFGGIQNINLGSVIFLSLSLAFVFSDVAQVHLRARAAVISEADALRTLGRISLSLDAKVGDPLMAALRQYTQDVLQKEWPEMSRAGGAAFSTNLSSALGPLTRMSDIVSSPQNQLLLNAPMTNQLILLTNRVREQRLLRAEASRYTIGYPRLGLVLFLLSVAIAVLTLSAITKRPMQIVSNFTLLWLALISLLVVYTQQNPFAALDNVSPLPLEEALQRLQVMKKAGS